MNKQIISIPNDDASKFNMMQQLATVYGHHPWFRGCVGAEITPHISDGYDHGAIANAIMCWIGKNIRYLQEAGEQITTPWQTIVAGYGDCDDLVVLAGCLLTAVGVGWRFEAVGLPAQHVLINVWDGASWVPYELTVRV